MLSCIKDWITNIINNLDNKDDSIVDNVILEEYIIKESKKNALNMYSKIEICDKTSNIIGIECIICLEEFIVNDEIRILNCMDYYHKKCIDKWLINRSMFCPYCQQDIIIPKNNHNILIR